MYFVLVRYCFFKYLKTVRHFVSWTHIFHYFRWKAQNTSWNFSSFFLIGSELPVGWDNSTLQVSHVDVFTFVEYKALANCIKSCLCVHFFCWGKSVRWSLPRVDIGLTPHQHLRPFHFHILACIIIGLSIIV